MKMTEKRTQFLNHVWDKYGTGSEISKTDSRFELMGRGGGFCKPSIAGEPYLCKRRRCQKYLSTLLLTVEIQM